MVFKIPSDVPLATSSHLNIPPPKLSVVRNPASRVRQAVRDNNVALLSRLQHKTDLRNTDKNRLTSLSWAAIEGSLEVFEWLLLDYGHDDQELSRDGDNNTILHLLASVPSLSPSPYIHHLSSPAFPPRLQSLSIEEQSNISLRMTQVYHTLFPFLLDWSNSGGKTALHVAAQAGNWRFISLLCELGADVDLTDLQGNTPLHYASAWGHLDTIKVLLDRGSSFAARNFDGFTASDFAYSDRINSGLQTVAREIFEERRSRKKEERGTANSIMGDGGRGRSGSASASSMGGSSSVGPASYGSQPGRYMGSIHGSGGRDQPLPPLPPDRSQAQTLAQSQAGGYGERTSSLPMSRFNSSASASGAASVLSFPIPNPKSGTQKAATSSASLRSMGPPPPPVPAGQSRPPSASPSLAPAAPAAPQTVLGRPTPPLQPGSLQTPAGRPLPGRSPSMPLSSNVNSGTSNAPLTRGQSHGAALDLAPPLPTLGASIVGRGKEEIPPPPEGLMMGSVMRRANSAQVQGQVQPQSTGGSANHTRDQGRI